MENRFGTMADMITQTVEENGVLLGFVDIAEFFFPAKARESRLEGVYRDIHDLQPGLA